MQRNRTLFSSVLATGLGLVMASQAESAIYLDLGHTMALNPAPAPEYDFTWNTISGAAPGFTVVADLLDQTGATTGISYTTTDIWVFSNDSGPTTTSGAALEFQKAARDMLYLDNVNTQAIVELGNLNDAAYDFTFFAFHTNPVTTGRLMNVTAQGAGSPVSTGSFATGNDSGMQDGSTLIHLTGIVPDAGNKITLTFNNASNSTFVYLGAIKITPVPEPASLGLLSLGGLALLRRSRRESAAE